MKYLIYLRVSTKEQDEETQLDHSLRFIKQRDKTDFKYEVYRDVITSRKPLFKRVKTSDGKAEITTIPRAGAKAMMENLNKGDVIVAMRFDRLARSSLEIHLFIDILKKLEAEVLLVTQPGIENKVMLGVFAGMAEEEVKLLRKRVSEKLEAKRNKGERYSGYLPYGFRLHETKKVPIKVGEEIVMKRGILVPIYEEQQILKKMQELASFGYSYQEIANQLTELGYLNREDKPFQKMTIYRILRRREKAMLGNQTLHAEEPQSSLALTQ